MKKTENKKNTAADPVSQDYVLVNNAETLEKLINKVKKAQEILSTFSQEKIDHIFRAAAVAANKARIPLAKMAYEETGMGVMEDKVIKNHFASEYIYNKHKNIRG